MSRLAILFDLDGTLIDSIDLLLQSMEAAFADHPRRPTRAQWVAGIGTPLRTQLGAWCDHPEDVNGLVDRSRTYQDAHLEQMTTMYPDVAETIAWARAAGHAIGLVTSKGRIPKTPKPQCSASIFAFVNLKYTRIFLHASVNSFLKVGKRLVPISYMLFTRYTFPVL